MSSRSKKIIFCLAAVVLVSVICAYFVRPKPPRLELVSPKQELPDYLAEYPGNTKLADRVAKSYGIAMVLMEGPYTDRNVIALEYLRSWAQDRFQEQPEFLHPISLEPPNEPHDTIIDSTLFNIFAAPRYFLEECVGDFLTDRIDQFHDTDAYTSFRTAYFDLFGLDGDAATLLARYQTEKGKLAIGTIIWSLAWLVVGFLAIVSIIRSKSRFTQLQRVLAYGWIALSLSYLTIAWQENELPFLVSSVVCGAVGLYLRKPFVLSLGEETGALRVRFIGLGSHWISLVLWLSMSLLAIQVFTWIRTGTPADPDPVTLLLSSLSGNFLQDPALGKRYLLQALGAAWLGLGLWTITQLKGDRTTERKVEEELASLKGPL